MGAPGYNRQTLTRREYVFESKTSRAGNVNTLSRLLQNSGITLTGSIYAGYDSVNRFNGLWLRATSSAATPEQFRSLVVGLARQAGFVFIATNAYAPF